MASAVLRGRQQQLQQLLQQLDTHTPKDRVTAVENLAAFLDALVEQGVLPTEALGQHVCSNAMILLMNNFVRPGQAGRGRGTGRREVARPFRATVTAMHRGVGIHNPFPPFAWKQCRAWHALFRHISETVANAELVGYAPEYAAMLARLMEYDVYKDSVPAAPAQAVFATLLRLLQQRHGAVEPDDLFAFADALVGITSAPLLTASFLRTTAATRDALVRLRAAASWHHEGDGVTAGVGLRHQACLIRAFTTVLIAVGSDGPAVAAGVAEPLVRLLCDAWHLTGRRDAWRMEAIRLFTASFLLCFGNDGAGTGGAEEGGQQQQQQQLGAEEEEPRWTTAALALLHGTLLPWALAALDDRRCEFTSVMLKDLSHHPCPPLATLFDLCARILGAAMRSAVAFRQLDDTDGPPAAKRRRLESPVGELRGRLQRISHGDLKGEPALAWLHCAAHPAATQYMSDVDADACGVLLATIVGSGNGFDHVALAALRVLLPRGSQSLRRSVCRTAESRFIVAPDADAAAVPVAPAFFLVASVLAAAPPLPTPTDDRSAAADEAAGPIVPSSAALGSRYLRDPRSFEACVVAVAAAVAPFVDLRDGGGQFTGMLEMLTHGLALQPHARLGVAVADVAEAVAALLGGPQAPARAAAAARRLLPLAGASTNTDAPLAACGALLTAPLSMCALAPAAAASAAGLPCAVSSPPATAALFVDAVVSAAALLASGAAGPSALGGACRLLDLLCTLVAAGVVPLPLPADAAVLGRSDVAVATPADVAALRASLSTGGAAYAAAALLAAMAAAPYRSAQGFLAEDDRACAAVEALFSSAALCTVAATPAFALADPRQRFVGLLGAMGRRAWECARQGLRLLREGSGEAQSDEARAVLPLSVAAALTTTAHAVAMWRAAPSASAASVDTAGSAPPGATVASAALDPLVTARDVAHGLREELDACGFTGAAPPGVAPRALLVLPALLGLATTVAAGAPPSFLADLLGLVEERYRFGCLEEILRCYTRCGSAGASEPLPPPAVAAVAGRLGNLVRCLMAAAAADDDAPHGGGAALPPYPELTPAMKVALVGAAAAMLPHCGTDPATGEVLGKAIFALSDDASFAVRAAAAAAVAVPLCVFSRPDVVFATLLPRLKVLTATGPPCPAPTAATALAALVGAAVRQPAVEGAVVSFLAECAATRGFAHRALLFFALGRIAHARGLLADTPPPPPGGGPGRKGGSGHAAWLVGQHMPRLCYDWLVGCHHPLDAFPFALAGQASLHAFVVDATAVLLPLAVLELHRSADGAGGGALTRVFAAHGATVDGAALLRAQFAPLVAALAAWAHNDAGDAASVVVAEAARAGLSWVELQLGEQLFRQHVRRHCEDIVVAVAALAHAPPPAATPPALPFVTLRAAARTLEWLAPLGGGGAPSGGGTTLASFFRAHAGDRAGHLAWSVFAAAAAAPTARAERLRLLSHAAERWFGNAVLGIPHVHTVLVHVACHALRAFAADGPARDEACALLGVLVAHSERPALLRCSPLVASTVAAFGPSCTAPAAVQAVWVSFCSAAGVDATATAGALPPSDWRRSLHRARLLREHSSQQVAAAAAAAPPPTAGTVDDVASLLAACAAFAGQPPAAFFDELAATLDAHRAVAARVAATTAQAVGDNDTFVTLARKLCAVASAAFDAATRVAALDALRSVVMAAAEGRGGTFSIAECAHVDWEKALWTTSGGGGAAPVAVPAARCVQRLQARLLVHALREASNPNPTVALCAAAVLRRTLSGDAGARLATAVEELQAPATGSTAEKDAAATTLLPLAAMQPYRRDRVAAGARADVRGATHEPVAADGFIGSIDAAALWTAAAMSSPDAWLRRFTASLLASDVVARADETFAAMAPLATWSTEFAREALPCVLLHIAVRHPLPTAQLPAAVAELRATLAVRLSEAVFPTRGAGDAAPAPAHGRAPAAITRAFLAAFAAVRAANFRRIVSGEWAAAAQKAAAVNEATAVQDTWWVPIGAVALADAALACDEPQHAALYIECSMDRKGEGLLALHPPATLAAPLGDVGAPPVVKRDPAVPPHVTRAAATEAIAAATAAGLRSAALERLQVLGGRFGDSDAIRAVCKAMPTAAERLRGTNFAATLPLHDTHASFFARHAEEPAVDAIDGLADALRRLGCAYAVACTLRVAADDRRWQSAGARTRLAQLAAEAAWRHTQWDAAPTTSGGIVGQLEGSPTGGRHTLPSFGAVVAASRCDSFDSAVLAAVCAVRSTDNASVAVAVARGRELLADALQPRNVLRTCVRMEMLRCIPLAAAACNGGGGWAWRQPLAVDPYTVAEPHDALLHVLAGAVGRSGARGDASVAACRVAVAARARRNGEPGVALARLEGMDGGPVAHADAAALRAKCLWDLGDRRAALHVLQSISPDARTPKHVRLLAQWALDEQLLPASTIVRVVLPPAAAADPSGKGHLALATMADTAFREASNVAASREAVDYESTIESTAAAVRTLEDQLAEAQKALAQANNDKLAAPTSATRARAAEAAKANVTSLNTRLVLTRRECESSKAAALAHSTERTMFRACAALHYARYLATAGADGAAARHALQSSFRVVALWLDSGGPAGCGPLPEDTVDAIASIPAWRLLPVFPQLVVRLGACLPSVTQLVTRIASAHVYQCAWHILALENGARFSPGEATIMSEAVDGAKVRAASELLALLRAGRLRDTITQMTQLCNAYIELAFQPPPKDSAPHPIAMDPGLRLLACKQLTLVPLPTNPVPVQPDGGCNLAEVGTVAHFRNTFEMVGGVNAPKVVHCVLSNGHVCRQLVKARDELRQDAIIQQVFSVCNTLLAHDKATRGASVCLRGYCVVPLSPTSGLVQWVENCPTLSECLVGDNGAHPRHFPADMHTRDCRSKIEQGQKANDAVKAFNEVCAVFHPAMHYVFLERYSNPAQWLAGRATYTGSLAAASIVGYLVGLGDRHVNNILLDEASCEVVHIDLGMAFEQAALLPIPERMPFRLTRDLVDALGIHGVDGAFRGGCEAAMATLRRNKELLFTVLEAFIHDPLAKWAVKTTGGASADDRHRSKTKLHASSGDRATARVRAKLAGYEGSEALGVAGQVQKLILTATDVNVLANAYGGWSAWV